MCYAIDALNTYDDYRYSPVREVVAERKRQEDLWGQQNHPDVIKGCVYLEDGADFYKAMTEYRNRSGILSYADILLEEVAEAFDEAAAGDKQALRTELVQVAAVAVAWVEKLDRENNAQD